MRKDLCPCPSCAGPATPFVSSRDFNRASTSQQFHYYSCPLCGLVFMDDVPHDLRPFYAGGYAHIPSSAVELRTIAATERYRLDPLLRYKQGGHLLEIGPWRGVFAVNALDAGFSVSAIEMDQDCVDFLRSELGVDALQSTDPAATLASSSTLFDVIALWHSLEHMREPWNVIAQAATHLAPEGLLLLALPNIASFEFSALRGRWRHLDSPRHLTFYPPEALTRLCEGHGLQLLELRTHDHLSELLARETWIEWAQRHLGKTRSAIRLANQAGHFAAWIEKSRKHSGSNITAVFQRVTK